FKLPLIPPVLDSSVWSFIVSNPYSLHDPTNWARYTLIGIAWLTTLTLWIHDRGPESRIYTKLLRNMELRVGLKAYGTHRRRNDGQDLRGLDRHRHRARPCVNSGHIHNQRFDGACALLRRAVARHHHPAALRGHHP